MPTPPLSLACLPFASFKFFDRCLSNELPAPVLASDGVNTVFDVGWNTYQHGNCLDLGFERRASHAGRCD
jgi:hypothetical protein